MRTNRDGETIAAAFMAHKPKKTKLTLIGTNIYEYENGRRLVTDGNEILSYAWWLVAFWLNDDAIAITTDRYETGEWKSGKPKYSPTTDAHIGSVVQAAERNGFRDSGSTFVQDGRTYAIYRLDRDMATRDEIERAKRDESISFAEFRQMAHSRY